MSETTLASTLGSLGFSDKEMAIYLHLLRVGSAPASVLGSRTGILRSTAQYTCQQLEKKGVIRLARKGNTYLYTAEPPEKLLALIERERKMLSRREDGVQKILGALRSMMHASPILPRIRYYEDIEGIEQLLRDMPQQRRHIHTFSAGDLFAQTIPEAVSRYRRKSQKHFQSKKIIRAARYRSLHSADPRITGVETRYLRGAEEIEVDIQIVDDLVSMISIDRDAPVGIIIEHAGIAKAMRLIFLQLWSQLPSEAD
jgi:sugar-specific transcriptional regulator TrmB